MDMSIEFTFLRQFQLELAMSVGKLPMLAHQVMEHVSTCVVHTLQKYWDLKSYETTIAGQYN
jgi:hypothetical protein